MPRHPKHNYRSICTYHITLKKAEDVPDFSMVTGCPDSWYVHHYPIGKAIEDAIRSVPILSTSLKVYRYVIMPDHVHFLIRAIKYLDRSIGCYIGKLKVIALQNARNRGINLNFLFKRDFHDRILRPEHSLDDVYKYIVQNPYRLLVRKFHPEYFLRLYHLIQFDNIVWHAYGNLQLLQNPFKDAVICHRKDVDNPILEAELKANWLHTVNNGGVLVSAFIAKKEKEIRFQAEESKGKVIHIVNHSFGNFYKPAAHEFEQCHKGNLLIIAPSVNLPDSRQTYLKLNRLATYISNWQ